MTGGRGKSLCFNDVSKRFDDFDALTSIDLKVAAGEFLTLLGPSGSGKTTLLNIAAGYLDPTAGRVLIGDKDVTRVAPRHRHIGMVFQNYALFPHMTVRQNVSYGPTVRRLPKEEIRNRVETALAMVKMTELADRSVQALSGGQRQRVALARAIAAEPDVILMDEPLGALDRQLRKEVQLEIRRLHEAHGRTTIYVTHDQEEALVMSDRIAVMRDGRLAQLGSASELYHRPKNTFIARFLGESNLIRGIVERLGDGQATIRVARLGTRFTSPAADGLQEGKAAALLIRPENVRLSGDVTQGIIGQVEERVFLGEIEAVRLRLADDTEFWSREFATEHSERAGVLAASWNETAARILPIDD